MSTKSANNRMISEGSCDCCRMELWCWKGIFFYILQNKSVILNWKWKWRDIQPSMVTYTRYSCSAFTHRSAHTQQWTHTHTHTHRWTHTRSRGQPFMLRHPGSSWGFGAGHSLPQPTKPCRTETRTPNLSLWVRLSTIRPRLPQIEIIVHNNNFLFTILNQINETMVK